jgi:hypothetical protein
MTGSAGFASSRANAEQDHQAKNLATLLNYTEDVEMLCRFPSPGILDLIFHPPALRPLR